MWANSSKRVIVVSRSGHDDVKRFWKRQKQNTWHPPQVDPRLWWSIVSTGRARELRQTHLRFCGYLVLWNGEKFKRTGTWHEIIQMRRFRTNHSMFCNILMPEKEIYFIFILYHHVLVTPDKSCTYLWCKLTTWWSKLKWNGNCAFTVLMGHFREVFKGTLLVRRNSLPNFYIFTIDFTFGGKTLQVP